MSSFKYNYIARCNNFIYGYGFNNNLIRYDLDTDTVITSGSDMVPNTSNVRENDIVKMCVIDESNVIYLTYTGSPSSLIIHVNQYNFDTEISTELFTQQIGSQNNRPLARRLMYFTYNAKNYIALISGGSEYGATSDHGIIFSIFNVTDNILNEVSSFTITETWDELLFDYVTNPQLMGSNIVIGLVPSVLNYYGVRIYKLNLDTLTITSDFVPSTVNYKAAVDYSACDILNNHFYYIHKNYDSSGTNAKIIRVNITDFTYSVIPLTINTYNNVSFQYGRNNFYIQISGTGFYDKDGNSLGITGMTICDFDERNGRFYQRALSGKKIISRGLDDSYQEFEITSLPNNTLNYCKLVGDVFVIIRYVSSESYVVKAT